MIHRLSSLLLFLPGIVWGASFTVVELILPVIPPISLTLGRSIISLVMLLILMKFMGGYLPRKLSEWWPFMILGAVNLSVPFALTSWGQLTIDGGLTSILLSIMPLFTMLLAAWFTTDEQLTRPKTMGVSLGLLGIIILIGPDALAGVTDNFVAQLSIVASAFLYAIGAVYLRFVYPQQPQDLPVWGLRLRMIAAQFIGAIIILAPFSFWLEAPWTIRPTADIWIYMIFLGVGVTLLATMVYFWLIEQMGSSRASMTIYLIPVAGVITSAIVLGEELTVSMVIALGLIFIGIFVVNQG